MPLGSGARLGPYEVVSAIGSGGMGEVYRARDTRLGREVAIKVLPDSFADDPDRLARFAREAQLLASLNHPNIATIHGLEEGIVGAGFSRPMRALVMELVEGPTLAERIADGPIPVDEALPIARQIADALEAAHERGVIHRDLKPANIKLTSSGKAKVLDFGLAKLAGPLDGGSYVPGVGAGFSRPDVSLTPTMTSPAMMTGVGVLVGTAAYMSPEQARGKSVDRRADIWAFGCVLYEMLTGRQAFDPGETVSDAIAAILTKEPAWGALPESTPSQIRTLLRRCLQKDPQKRLPHIGVARIEIDEPASAPAPAADVVAPTRTRQRRSVSWPLAVVIIVAMMLVYSALPWLQDDQQPPIDAPEIRTSIVTAPSADPISLALSPDGKQIVFVASANGASQLWLRRLDKDAAQPLRGTEGARYPFWSPDSRSIAFSTPGKLMRLSLDGGAPEVVTTLAAGGRGGSWSKDGVILIAPNTGSPLMRVSASGGEVRPATKLVGQNGHRFPQFLPDGRRFLFFGFGTADSQGIYLGSLDSQDITKVVSSEGPGVYAEGILYWVRGITTLVAQRLDVEQRRLVGEVVTVADQVATDTVSGGIAVSVSQSGLIAYRTGGSNRRQFTWYDRGGRMLGGIGAPDDTLLAPRLSPDGRRVVANRSVQGNQDVWLLDGTRVSRFTFDPSVDRFPLWSPDGSKILFDSTRKGTRDFYVKSSTGANDEDLLLASMDDKSATDWSRDGRFVMYRSVGGKTGRDLMVLPLATLKPWTFLSTQFEENLGSFSPDLRWVAYQSNESGRFEVYVRPFIEPGGSSTRAGGQWQVSTDGGIQPHWRYDGAELYYINPEGQMMAVQTRTQGTVLEMGAPVKLFDTHIYGGGTDVAQGSQYDVARDGRFLINTVLDEATAPITIVQNWKRPAN